MNNIGILVVEDDLLITLDIERMIAELGYKHLGTFKDGDTALEAIKETKPDLIIMDIRIDGSRDGIETAEDNSLNDIPLIFITSYLDNEYFQRAKKTKPAAYLVKPFKMLELQRAIELALIRNDDPKVSDDNSWGDYVSNNGIVFMKLNNVLYKVSIVDVKWIEVDGNYCYLHTEDKRYILKSSLRKILDKINPHADFIRVHKQFIVQLRKIKSVNATDNTLIIDDKTIPIGRTFKKDLLNKLNLL